MGIWEEDNKEQAPIEITTNESPVREAEDELLEEASTPATPEKPIIKGLPVRVEGDRIWLLKDGKRHWVTSAEVYQALGFKFGDEREIDRETLMALPEGEPLR